MDTIGGGEVSLGDLADLTVTNDNDLSCDVSSQGAHPPRPPLGILHSGRVCRSLAVHGLCSVPDTGVPCEPADAAQLFDIGVPMQTGSGT